MRRTAALAAVSLASAALAAAACSTSEPKMPSTCTTTGADGYVRALAGAPDAVLLPGDVPISTCLERVRTDSELQNLGAVVHQAAESLAEAARAGDAGAALRLGYLAGAVGSGAERSSGVASELARRIETAGAGLLDGDAAVANALREGTTAGRQNG
jgi:hypothetical protein